MGRTGERKAETNKVVAKGYDYIVKINSQLSYSLLSLLSKITLLIDRGKL